MTSDFQDIYQYCVTIGHTNMLKLTFVGILIFSFFIPGDCFYYYYYSQAGRSASQDYPENPYDPCGNLRCYCKEHSDCNNCKDLEEFGSSCFVDGGGGQWTEAVISF